VVLPVLVAMLSVGQISVDRKWLVEIERRDSPILMTLELGENEAVFRSPSRVLRGTLTKVRDNTYTVTFKLNFVLGTGQMVLIFDGGRVKGTLNTSELNERVSGVVAPNSPPPRSSTVLRNGPGFGGFDIPAKLVASQTAGTSIARFEDGKVVEIGFYGVENSATGGPVSETTLFQAGGMGSVLTCLAALRMAGKGKLDLNATVASVLPRLKLAPKDGREIRVLDLLRGSSGLDQYKFRGYRQTENPPPLLDLLTGADLDQVNPLTVLKPIGEQNGFKGINQVILQAVMEEKTGKPFDSLMRDWILKPLAMSHSTFELRPRNGKGRSLASSHYETGEPMLFGSHIYPTQGDSGLWTTAPDMARALIEAGRLLAGQPNKILRPDKMGLLTLVDGPMGVAGFVRGDADTYFHGGDTYGQFCNFSLHPSRGVGIVVMTNRVMNWRFVGQVVDLFNTK
jgi:CubicO group peptidase (beta-lactamase class C family)